MQRSRLTSMIRSALFAALLAVGAIVTVPIGPVPITLQVLVLAVGALVLAPPEALAGVAVYLLAGALGAPVFSGGGAGVGVLAGPTGGFLIGFMLGTPAAALVRRALTPSDDATAGASRGLLADGAALLTMLAVVYALGWAWFALGTGRAAGEAFGLAVAPFVVIDAGKCAAALLVARGVRAAGLG